MSKKAAVTGTWHDKNQQVDFVLPLIMFEEDESKIVYCPALDLSGYGKNDNEAADSFKIVLDEYLIYTTRKQSLVADLKALGWRILKKGKELIPPDMALLLNQNQNFSRIFNSHDFRKTTTSVSLPIYS
ncbi:MAG: hypothetical protein NTW49_08640 [Bacteroidia bacterium]|nr:hypothetical protein [Bacteroidia bacterium]